MPAHSRTQLRFPGWEVESTDGWAAIIAEQSSLCLGFREGKVDLSPGGWDGGSRWEGGPIPLIMELCLGAQRSEAREGGRDGVGSGGGAGGRGGGGLGQRDGATGTAFSRL